MDELTRRFDRGDFDLVAVGRPLLSDPNWTAKIKSGEMDQLVGFSKEALSELIV
ncbi:NADH:flavin oxidoreductase / NADH oxidase family protein [compost metagenome]